MNGSAYNRESGAPIGPIVARTAESVLVQFGERRVRLDAVAERQPRPV